MSWDDFNRQAAREVRSAIVADRMIAAAEPAPRPVYTEQVAGHTVTFNQVQLAPSPDFHGEAAQRRTMTLAGLAMATDNEEVRRQMGPTGKEKTR